MSGPCFLPAANLASDGLARRARRGRRTPQRPVHLGGEARQRAQQHLAIQPVQDPLALALGGNEPRPLQQVTEANSGGNGHMSGVMSFALSSTLAGSVPVTGTLDCKVDLDWSSNGSVTSSGTAITASGVSYITSVPQRVRYWATNVTTGEAAVINIIEVHDI